MRIEYRVLNVELVLARHVTARQVEGVATALGVDLAKHRPLLTLHVRLGGYCCPRLQVLLPPTPLP